MSPVVLLPDHRRGRPQPSRRTLTTTEARAILRPRIVVQMELFEELRLQSGPHAARDRGHATAPASTSTGGLDTRRGAE